MNLRRLFWPKILLFALFAGINEVFASVLDLLGESSPLEGCDFRAKKSESFSIPTKDLNLLEIHVRHNFKVRNATGLEIFCTLQLSSMV